MNASLFALRVSSRPLSSPRFWWSRGEECGSTHELNLETETYFLPCSIVFLFIVAFLNSLLCNYSLILLPDVYNSSNSINYNYEPVSDLSIKEEDKFLKINKYCEVRSYLYCQERCITCIYDRYLFRVIIRSFVCERIDIYSGFDKEEVYTNHLVTFRLHLEPFLSQTAARTAAGRSRGGADSAMDKKKFNWKRISTI